MTLVYAGLLALVPIMLITWFVTPAPTHCEGWGRPSVEEAADGLTCTDAELATYVDHKG